MSYVNTARATDACKNCGVVFVRRYKGAGKRKEYCSLKCAGAARYRAVDACIVCGAEFKRIYRAGKVKKYCSQACYKEGRTARRPCMYRDYIIIGFARRIAENNGFLACESCGAEDYALLEVHHKDRDRKNNTPENLRVLCANCHSLEHRSDSGTQALRVKRALALAKTL